MRVAEKFNETSTAIYVDDTPGGLILEMPCGKECFVPGGPAEEPFYCPFTGVEVFYPKGAEW